MDTTIKKAKKFGLTMGIALGVIAALLLWRHRSPFFIGGLSLLFFVATYTFPRILIPVEKYWMAFGEKLSLVMSVVILTLTFYVMITPMAIVMRLLGKDILNLKLDRKRETYWENTKADNAESRYYLPY